MNNTAKEQSYYVVKSNELIRKSRFSMAIQQYKLLLYLVSKIKPLDTPSTVYSFTVSDFCRVCNIDDTSGKNYTDVKSAVKTLADRSIWINTPDGKEVLLRWIGTVHINRNSGLIEVKFHEDMFPFLLGLREHYTQYRLENVLPMRSKYGLRLYEYLKSFEGLEEYHSISLAFFNDPAASENYTRFPDFRRFALDKAIEDINTYSDLSVTYHLSKEKGSRAYSEVMFRIHRASDYDAERRALTRYYALSPVSPFDD